MPRNFDTPDELSADHDQRVWDFAAGSRMQRREAARKSMRRLGLKKEHMGPGPHASGTEQSSHGKGGESQGKVSQTGESPDKGPESLPVDPMVPAAKTVEEMLGENGGFTYQPVSGESPVRGYAVSPFPEATLAVKADEIDEGVIFDWLKEHKDRFNDKRVHAGGWIDDSSGDAVFDLSIVVADQEDARKIGRQYDQDAVYDLGRGETIRIREPEQPWRNQPGAGQPSEVVPAQTAS